MEQCWRLSTKTAVTGVSSVVVMSGVGCTEQWRRRSEMVSATLGHCRGLCPSLGRCSALILCCWPRNSISAGSRCVSWERCRAAKRNSREEDVYLIRKLLALFARWYRSYFEARDVLFSAPLLAHCFNTKHLLSSCLDLCRACCGE